MKLTPPYLGPYQILQRIGKAAHELQLPDDSRIYPVFHVSQLKKKLEESLPQSTDGQHIPTALPHNLLATRIVKAGKRNIKEVLVQCEGSTIGQGSFKGGRSNDMSTEYFDSMNFSLVFRNLLVFRQY